MKKSYLMIAAAAAFFAACSNTDTVKDIDTQESAISFNPFTEKVTRAAIQGATTASTVAGVKSLAEEGGFVVYGYKSTDNWATKSAPDIFAGVNVFYENNVWKYNGLRFWDKNAKYKFFAVAPVSPTDGATYSIDDDATKTTFGKITIDGAKSNIYSSSDDYLIDRDGAEENGSAHTNAANGNAAVSIDFHHVMAKVTFKLKSTLTTGKIKVTELKMKGYNNGVGIFAQDQTIGGAPSSLITNEWSFKTNDLTNEVKLVGTGTGDASGIEFNCDPNSAAANIKDVKDWYIMVPQAIAANKLIFTVTYTFTDDMNTTDTSDDYTETFTNQVATVTSAQTWGTDSYTNYTLDIKPAEIKFDVTSICTFEYNGGNQVAVTD